MINLKSLLILLFFLFIEILLLVFILISIANIKIFSFIKTQISLARQKKISAKIFEHIEGNRLFAPNRIFASRMNLLKVMEAYNLRLKGVDWETLKIALANRYLLPRARRWAHSFFWKRKNTAARIFALAPLIEDQNLILELLHNSDFLIASVAALASIQLELKEGIDMLLKAMSAEQGYACCYYRDILLQGSVKVFSYISKVALKGDDAKVHVSCLDVLSGKTVTCPLPFLDKDLASLNLKIRLGALKVLISNPPKDAAAIVLKYLSDPNEEIRAQAALGLASFPSPESFAKLEQGLKDDFWIVRSQAAASLKKMGEEGISILKKQTSKNDLKSYEVAQYALEFS